MGLYNNVPTFTYVSATGITVTYNDKIYTVQSFYTNKKYIYWDSDNGTVLQASNTMPTRSTKTHLVLINDNGIVTTVPSTSENFEISYDGDSDDAIKSRIYALYQKDKELGDKYVAIEQDVDGIKQLVGTSDGEDGTIIDRVSKIEQRADKIELSVSDIQTTYDDDKELQKVREDLTASIIELNSDLGVFGSELQDYYRNNEISSEEAVAIQAGLDQLDTSRQNVLNNLDILKGYIEVSDLSILNNATTEFNNAHIFLVQNVKVAISDSVIIPSEKTIIIDAIAKYNLQINQLKNTCDDIILLGLGGVITEKLSQISMTSNEIKLSVSTVDTKVDNQRTEFEENFSDVNNRLDSLDIVLDGTFENNIIDKTERATLNENITNLKIQKDDVDIEYEKLYNSSYLDGNLKVDYKNVYDDFVSKYNTLLDIINGILDKEDLINDDDRNNVTNAHDNLMSSIKVFINKSNEVIDYISEAQSKEINDKFDKEVSDLNNRVDDVVTDMNGVLRDDIIDQAERKVLEDGLNDLEIQKSDIAAQYQKIYSDINFNDVNLKRSLRQTYDNFIDKYNNFINSINSMLDKEGIIDDTDGNNYQIAYEEYKESIALFTEEYYKATRSITDKLVNELRSDLNNEISDLNNAITDLDETMNGVFKDGILSDAEKIAIREQLATLERERADIDVNHTTVCENKNLSYTAKSSLNAAYTTYNAAYNSLVTIVNKILDKTGIISTSEQNSYKNSLVNYRGKLTAYSQKLREALDNIVDSSIANLRSDLSNEISDVLGSLEDLESEMNASFKDGVLSDAEKTTIKQQVETLKKEKGDVDKQYTALYSNTSLVDTGTIKAKSELKTAYDNFVSKYNTLISTINTIISKTTNVTSTDRTNLETALSNYRTASATYVTKATNAIDVIAATKAETESAVVDKKYSEIILGEDGIISRVGSLETTASTTTSKISSIEVNITGITNRVSSTETSISGLESDLSEVEQTANKINWIVKSGTSSANMSLTSDAYKVIANNIDLTGKVTFNSFNSSLQTSYNTWNTASSKVTTWSGSGTSTVIDGAYIKTGSIKASHISSGSISSTHISSGSITATHISSQTLTGVTIKNSAGTFIVNPSGSITIGSSSSYRTYITNSGMTFNDSSGYYYSKLSGGRFYFTDSSGNNVGHVGRSVWTNTSIYLTALNADYGNTAVIGAKQSSSSSTYITDLIESSISQWIGSNYYYQGLNIINPYVGGKAYFRGSTADSTFNTYLGKIYNTTSDYLCLEGYQRTYLSTYGGTGMYAAYNSSAKNGSDMHLYANMYCHNFYLYNAYVSNSLSATSSYTRSLKDNSSLDMYTYAPYSLTQGELRYTEREPMTTYEEYDNGSPTGRYICYCELPIFMAENLELNYHINIGKISFGDYKIIEKTQYYFILESEKEGFAFTYEVVGKQIEKSDNNAVVANIGFTENDEEEATGLEYEMN